MQSSPQPRCCALPGCNRPCKGALIDQPQGNRAGRPSQSRARRTTAGRAARFILDLCAGGQSPRRLPLLCLFCASSTPDHASPCQEAPNHAHSTPSESSTPAWSWLFSLFVRLPLALCLHWIAHPIPLPSPLGAESSTAIQSSPASAVSHSSRHEQHGPNVPESSSSSGDGCP